MKNTRRESSGCIFLLSVVGFGTVFAGEVLVLHMGRSGDGLRVQLLGTGSHLCHFFQHHGIVYRFCGRFAPGKGTVVGTEHTGNISTVFICKGLSNDTADTCTFDC